MVAFAAYPYEMQRAIVEDALGERWPGACIIAQYPDHVIFRVADQDDMPYGAAPVASDPDGDGDNDADDFFSVPFTVNAGGDVQFGQPQEVMAAPPDWQVVNDGDEGPGGTGEQLSDATPRRARRQPANLLLSDDTERSWYDQVTGWGYVSFRLADTAGGALPAWQPIARIGDWVVPHGVSGKIQITRAMCESFARNFRAGVLRRRVPMDERHLTEQNGIALAWLEEMRWGQADEIEPSGRGDTLYGRWDYNQLGEQRLSDRQYLYFSPQYSLDYVDKQTGTHYGPTLLALAGTNDPFIRTMRDALGNGPLPWVNPAEIAMHDLVALDDQITPRQQEDAMPPTQNTQRQAQAAPSAQAAQQGQPPAAAGSPALSDEVSALRAEIERERQAREAIEHQLADERRGAHRAQVDSRIDALVRRGFPPGAFAGFRKLLKQLEPAARPVISLSDDPAAQPDLTLAEAVMHCLEEIPSVDLRAKTWPADVRPKEAIELEEQVAEKDEATGKALVQRIYADRVQRNGAA